MYSQQDEEKIIVEYFGDTIGRFLDIGAYNGKTFSNTYRLVEYGWQGVMVEPSPYNFVGLVNNMKGNKDLTLVNCALSKKSEIKLFYESCGDAISSLSEMHVRIWNQKNYTGIFIKTITAEELFGLFGSQYDFINLDVEGNNIEVLDSFPANVLENVSLLCVEYDGMADKVISRSVPHGLIEMYRNDTNIIMGRI